MKKIRRNKGRPSGVKGIDKRIRENLGGDRKNLYSIKGKNGNVHLKSKVKDVDRGLKRSLRKSRLVRYM